ncbi:MAG: arsenite methyltransferase, partial [Nitrospira sp.]|nr:arsenite methyltransferase [Nitrospira sp.]
QGCGCCGTEGHGSCGPESEDFAKSIGYSDEELKAIPDEANLGLGCGNPTALASLKEDEVVLDLGSGAGLDCFLAALKVGPKGRVIGVDMTPEMIERANENAKRNGVQNVEFRLGEIENLPIQDNSVDVVISNCVINLSVDKPKVFKEAYRVLKSNGRITISDIALLKELPRKTRKSLEAYVGCVGGAMLVNEYKERVEASGFRDVRVMVKGTSSCIDPKTQDPVGKLLVDSLERGDSLEGYVVSVSVEGYK